MAGAKPGREPVPGLGLHRFQHHARFAQPGQARVPQLMAGRVFQPGPAAGAGQDLIQALRRQGQSAPRSLEDHEYPVRGRCRGTLVVQVVTQRPQEPAGDGDDALVTALALGDEQAPVPDAHIGHPQAQDLAAPQPGQDHCQHHCLVPVGAQRIE
jgi:hypothetical protein